MVARGVGADGGASRRSEQSAGHGMAYAVTSQGPHRRVVRDAGPGYRAGHDRDYREPPGSRWGSDGNSSVASGTRSCCGSGSLTEPHPATPRPAAGRLRPPRRLAGPTRPAAGRARRPPPARGSSRSSRTTPSLLRVGLAGAAKELVHLILIAGLRSDQECETGKHRTASNSGGLCAGLGGATPGPAPCCGAGGRENSRLPTPRPYKRRRGARTGGGGNRSRPMPRSLGIKRLPGPVLLGRRRPHRPPVCRWLGRHAVEFSRNDRFLQARVIGTLRAEQPAFPQVKAMSCWLRSPWTG